MTHTHTLPHKRSLIRSAEFNRPRLKRWGAVFSAAALLTFAATGCVSKVTGNEGNLTFQYPADDQLLDFNKPIAIGAKLDIAVREVGTPGKLVELTAAKSDDAKVLKVNSFQGPTFVLEGVGEGAATIEVSAKQADGSTVTDSVNMLARAADVLKMRHYCTSDSDGHYLVDSDILIPFDLERKNGQAVIGYGYHPIKITPATGASLDQVSKSQINFHLHTADTAQEVTLASTIDSTKLTLMLHTQGDIDGARMEGGEAANKARVALTHFLLIRPTIKGNPVCQANAEFSAESTTPETCAVKALTTERKGKDVTTGFGWVQITGKKAGKCNFNITYPKGSDDKGTLAAFAVDVTK